MTPARALGAGELLDQRRHPGMTMSIDSTSSIAVTQMKVIAALLARSALC